MKLRKQNAIITGGAQGMGGTISRTLVAAGATVFLTGRTKEPLNQLVDEIRANGGNADCLPGDVTIEEDVQAIVEAAKAVFAGRIDILINAAGATGPIETPVWEIDREAFSDLMEKNVIGTFLPMKHVLPTMIEQRYGKIVNIGGGSGLRGYKYRAGYSSSKWAIRGLTRTAALDAGSFNINCNAIMPGIVETPRMEKLCRVKAEKRGTTYEEVYEEYLEETALHRITTPQDIANASVFLASEDSKNITGQELSICGGWAV